MHHPLDDLKNHIAQQVDFLVSSAPHFELHQYIKLVVPPTDIDADFCFSTYALAKVLQLEPLQLAKEIVAKLSFDALPLIKNVRVIGPYVNFEIHKDIFAVELVRALENFSTQQNQKNHRKTIVIDCSVSPSMYSSLDFLRPIITTHVLGRFYKTMGHAVIRRNFLYDPQDANVQKLKQYYKNIGITFDKFQTESATSHTSDHMIAELARCDEVSYPAGDHVMLFHFSANVPPVLLRRADASVTSFVPKMSDVKNVFKKYRPDALIFIVPQKNEVACEQLMMLLHRTHINPALTRMEHLAVGQTKFHQNFSADHTLNEKFDDILKRISSRVQKMDIDPVLISELSRAALFYGLIRVPANENIVFRPEDFVYEKRGYFFVRKIYNALLKMASESKPVSKPWNKDAFLILQKLGFFPFIAQEALEHHAPYLLCTYIEDIARKTHEYLRQSTSDKYINSRLSRGIIATIRSVSRLLDIKI